MSYIMDHLCSWLQASCAISPYDYLNLPHSVFCCRSLVELRLFLRNSMIKKAAIPRSTKLPFLKKLSLGSLNIPADFIEKLLLGCPLLEELEIKHCFLPIVRISCLLLKHLTISDCQSHNMIISCPNLINLYLVYINFAQLSEIFLRNLSSLKNAFLYFPISFMGHCEILSGLSNATEIKLFGIEFKTILEEELPNCSTFNNLKQLVLDERLKSGEFDIMGRFFQCSPNLDKFYFSNVTVAYHSFIFQ